MDPSRGARNPENSVLGETNFLAPGHCAHLGVCSKW